MGLGALVIEVVLPTYNGAAYLKEQVDSIHRQTLRPQRLLVRDDGSSDGTQALLAELQQHYGAWLHLLPSEKNLGCSANVNRLAGGHRSALRGACGSRRHLAASEIGTVACVAAASLSGSMEFNGHCWCIAIWS